MDKFNREKGLIKATGENMKELSLFTFPKAIIHMLRNGKPRNVSNKPIKKGGRTRKGPNILGGKAGGILDYNEMSR